MKKLPNLNHYIRFTQHLEFSAYKQFLDLHRRSILKNKKIVLVIISTYIGDQWSIQSSDLNKCLIYNT